MQTTAPPQPEARVGTKTYVSVLVVEFLVLTALWLAGRYFGSV